MSTEESNRRAFLKAVLAVGGAAMIPTDASAQGGTKSVTLDEFIDKLAESNSLGVDGRKIDVQELKAQLRGKNVALTFGFQGCEGFCIPHINPELQKLHGMSDKKNFVSLCVNTVPGRDRDNARNRQKWEDELRGHAPKKEHKIICVFPQESTLDLQRSVGRRVLGEIEGKAAHTSYITLFQNGKVLGAGDSTTNEGKTKLERLVKDNFVSRGR